MVKAKRLVFGVLVAVAVTGGHQVTAADPAQAAELAGTSWLAEDIDGRGVVDRVRSTLTFGADGRVHGSTGCNRYFGPVTINERSISFGALGITRMACPPAIMDQEGRFISALENAKRFELQGDRLEIFGDAPTPLLRLAATEPAPSGKP